VNDGWNLLLLDDKLWVLNAPTGVPIYDFDFRAFFPCTTPWQRTKEVLAVGRIGAFADYETTYSGLLAEGVRLVHSPELHFRISQLPGWYPLIEAVTPRSRWFSEIPSASDVEQDFQWPVFVKGIRQTSRHQRSLAIISNPEQFESAMEVYGHDRILRWQPLVVREYVPLRPVEDSGQTRIPSSFEFRTFWWRGRCVGAGRYWWEGRMYDWNPTERQQALALAEDAAQRVNACFVVVDIAMTATGRWIVIECNDGQESGYAGVSPIGLWQKILRIEEEH
jgi:hypothetical protein